MPDRGLDRATPAKSALASTLHHYFHVKALALTTVVYIT